MAKDVKKKGENAKVAIRNIRRDANDALKKANKAAEMSDDELKGNEENDRQVCGTGRSGNRDKDKGNHDSISYEENH